MRLSDFYMLDNITSRIFENKTLITAAITINTNHPILQGHFPGLPVVPGVCMVEIIKKISENFLEKKLGLIAAANIKFLTVLTPVDTQIIQAEVHLFPTTTPDVVESEARLFSGDIIYFKMKAQFSIAAAD